MSEKESMERNVESLAKEIADWMIAEGTENTSSGGWCIYFNEINKKFGTDLPSDKWLLDKIVDAVYKIHRVKVAGLVVDEYFDFIFYSGYCPNYSSWPGEG